MSESSQPLPEDYGCNCDYYGTGNCLKHNLDHPAHQIYRLQAQLEQSEARLALVVEALEYYGKETIYQEHYAGLGCTDILILHDSGKRAREALTATAAQVSSYRDSLLAQGREQGVRDCIEVVSKIEPSTHLYGERIPQIGQGAAIKALTATAAQVSSYRESLLAQGREQGVRDCIDHLENDPMFQAEANGIYEEGHEAGWGDAISALKSLHNQGGV